MEGGAYLVNSPCVEYIYELSNTPTNDCATYEISDVEPVVTNRITEPSYAGILCSPTYD